MHSASHFLIPGHAFLQQVHGEHVMWTRNLRGKQNGFCSLIYLREVKYKICFTSSSIKLKCYFWFNKENIGRLWCLIALLPVILCWITSTHGLVANGLQQVAAGPSDHLQCVLPH